MIDPEATPDPSLPVLPSLVVTVASDCDHTPHLNLQPDYEACKLLLVCHLFSGKGTRKGRTGRERVERGREDGGSEGEGGSMWGRRRKKRKRGRMKSMRRGRERERMLRYGVY